MVTILLRKLENIFTLHNYLSDHVSAKMSVILQI